MAKFKATRDMEDQVQTSVIIRRNRRKGSVKVYRFG